MARVSRGSGSREEAMPPSRPLPLGHVSKQGQRIYCRLPLMLLGLRQRPSYWKQTRWLKLRRSQCGQQTRHFACSA